jgi:hypothetical protein
MGTTKNRKAESDKLTESVQVMFKKHEKKILERIRLESNFPTLSGFLRMHILKLIEGKRQTELF